VHRGQSYLYELHRSFYELIQEIQSSVRGTHLMTKIG